MMRTISVSEVNRLLDIVTGFVSLPLSDRRVLHSWARLFPPPENLSPFYLQFFSNFINSQQMKCSEIKYYDTSYDTSATPPTCSNVQQHMLSTEDEVKSITLRSPETDRESIVSSI